MEKALRENDLVAVRTEFAKKSVVTVKEVVDDKKRLLRNHLIQFEVMKMKKFNRMISMVSKKERYVLKYLFNIHCQFISCLIQI